MSQALRIALASAAFICIISLILKNFGYKGAPITVCLGILCIASAVSEGLAELLPSLRAFGADHFPQEYMSSAVKLVGVGYVCGICSDLCGELGEGLVGKYVTVAGRFEMIAIAAPYVSEILEKVGEYI